MIRRKVLCRAPCEGIPEKAVVKTASPLAADPWGSSISGVNVPLRSILEDEGVVLYCSRVSWG